MATATAAASARIVLPRPIDIVSLDPLNQTAVVDQNGHSYNGETRDQLLAASVAAGRAMTSPHTRGVIDPARFAPNYSLRESMAVMDRIESMVNRLHDDNVRLVSEVRESIETSKKLTKEIKGLRHDLRVKEKQLDNLVNMSWGDKFSVTFCFKKMTTIRDRGIEHIKAPS